MTALDNSHIQHSTSFPSRCTITVDGQTQQAQGGLSFPPPPNSANPYEWQLPTNDAHNPMQRLHTLDIYFWSSGDADQFLDSVENYLSRAQVETDRHPYPPGSSEGNATSTVVQQLENVAITDPAYQNGQTRNSQSEAAVVSPALVDIPPPPPMGNPAASPQHTSSISPPAEQKRDSAQLAPLPYNPAAPAAPEPIKHRQKTPPPPDAADGTGLAAAIAADNGVSYTNPGQTLGGGYPATTAAGIPPPPQPQLAQVPTTPYSIPGSYASPPPSAGLPRTGSFPPQPPIQSPPMQTPPIQSPPATTPSYPPTHLQGGTQQQIPITQPVQPVHTYAAQPQQVHQIQNQQQPPSFYGSQVPAVGGYSNYTYDQTPNPQHQHQHHHQHHHSQHHHHQPSSSEYSIHGQMYRPTEAEAGSHLQEHAKLAVQQPPQRSRKLEDSASKVEGSVNRFLKKLEKRL